MMASGTETYDVGLVCKLTSPVPETCCTRLTVKDGTNLYQDSKCFELHKQYLVVKKHNDQLGQVVYALMEGDTYCGSLTGKGGREVDHLFQTGRAVMVYVTKVHPSEAPRYNKRLGRTQQFTHGRGNCWQEADEQREE